MEISDEDAEELKRQGDEYRLIDYPKNSEGKKILGMESKDMKDVSSLLLDHSIGEEPGSLNLKLIEKKCKKDKKCGQTVRLNLENTYANIERVPKEVDLGTGLTTIKERLERILEGIPEASKKWSPPWWNTDVVTPKIIK